MKIFFALISILFANIALSAECEPALHNLVKILSGKRELTSGKNTYAEGFDEAEFSGSCETTYEGQKYKLFLHRDQVTIVVARKEATSDLVEYQGPFYSAYRK